MTTAPASEPPVGQQQSGLTRAAIGRAIPPGSRRIQSQREALRGGLGCPDLAGVRADFRKNLTTWWQIHVNHASWGGQGRPPLGITEPSRARVCALAGMSASTYKACRRWWEERGYIAIVRPGWTPALRAAVLTGPSDQNIRQAYVLCLPRTAGTRRPEPRGSSACQLTRPLTGSRRDSVRFPAREDAKKEQDKQAETAAPRSPVLSRGPLAGLTDGWWAHITAPFAHWTADDLVYAVDHLPDGRQHRTRLSNVRHPAGWLRWRLSHWLSPDGTPLPSPSQQRAEAAEQRRAQAAADHARYARTPQPADVAHRGAQRARAQLAASGGYVAVHLARHAASNAARQHQAASRAGRPGSVIDQSPQLPGVGAGLLDRALKASDEESKRLSLILRYWLICGVW